jgi:hypothetical protein
VVEKIQVRAFFEYIKARIEDRIPELKVEVYNNQFVRADTDRTEKAIRYPICYVEFIVEDVNNFSRGFKDYFMRIRFRLGLESYKFQRLETFDFADQFYSAIHLMRPTQASGLIFSSFQEMSTEFDEDHNNVDHPFIDYRTKYRSQVAYHAPGILSTPLDLLINVEAGRQVTLYEDEELSPLYMFEEEEDKPTYFYEKWQEL